MKRLLALLLLSPTLATAQQMSGTGTILGNFAEFDLSGPGVSFSISGPVQGAIGQQVMFPGGVPFTLGGGAATPDTFADLTVGGVGYYVPPGNLIVGGFAGMKFSAAFPAVTQPGPVSGGFHFEGSFVGYPDTFFSQGCLPNPPCRRFGILGSGTETIDAQPFPGVPGAFFANSGSVFLSAAHSVPEPSSASLMWIAFAGLAIAGGGRRLRARLFPAG